MLEYTDKHTPAGILDLKIATVEQINDLLKDTDWEMMNTDHISEIQSVHATIGNARFNKPDIVYGNRFSESYVPIARITARIVLDYLDECNGQWKFGVLDMVHFREFVLLKYENFLSLFPENYRIKLRLLNADRWFAGTGWIHATYYNQTERKNAMFIQLLESDNEGNLPEDTAYTGDMVALFETHAFATGVKNRQISPKAKYLH